MSRGRPRLDPEAELEELLSRPAEVERIREAERQLTDRMTDHRRGDPEGILAFFNRPRPIAEALLRRYETTRRGCKRREFVLSHHLGVSEKYLRRVLPELRRRGLLEKPVVQRQRRRERERPFEQRQRQLERDLNQQRWEAERRFRRNWRPTYGTSDPRVMLAGRKIT